ncbi:hypothetical protein KHA96_14985 [Bacillus sp. FJAT-49711]|uniref:hypothetical protein n=1 Tax=Bacillus sp. FJAT-49711 TaxID=2833585 RepID=UPI001BC927A8|nr:hypothetical protein [Bacillus sp. FJAT-49711]MBS4219619.1 hypothetical protein [Bacillus sp. FJAT-49711]
MDEVTNIQLNDMKIRSIDRKSYVSMGSSIQLGNHVFNHRSEGFGEQSGDGTLKDHTVSVVDDSDLIDFFITKMTKL